MTTPQSTSTVSHVRLRGILATAVGDRGKAAPFAGEARRFDGTGRGSTRPTGVRVRGGRACAPARATRSGAA